MYAHPLIVMPEVRKSPWGIIVKNNEVKTLRATESEPTASSSVISKQKIAAVTIRIETTELARFSETKLFMNRKKYCGDRVVFIFVATYLSVA
jgi:hypothetical protein